MKSKSSASKSKWGKAETSFYMLVRQTRKIHKMPYSCTFDFLVDGWRVEFKHGEPQSRASKTTPQWKFNIHRHGKLNEQCDFYVLCLAGAPYSAKPIYLLYRAPVGTTTIRISMTTLMNGDSDHVKEFDEFLVGKYGIGPYMDREALKP